MRCRLTVADGTTGLRSDVVVEGDAADPAEELLAPLVTVLQLGGAPTVDGQPLAHGARAGDVLREGAVLHYGGGGPAPRGAAGAAVLRVVSGPDAGTVVPLADGAAIDIGRRSTAGLRLDDPDVSRLHATVAVRGGAAELTDRGSSNGVLVDGVAISGPHPLREGEVVQVGGTRIVLERPDRARAVLEPSGDGGLIVNRRYPDRRAPFAPPAVTLPSLPPEDDARGLPVLAMALPAVLSVVLAFVLGSPIYLLFGLMSPLLVGGNWWSDRRRRIARDARREGSYGEALRAATAQVEQGVADEDADVHARRPDPGTVERIALTPRVELWSRRPGEDGWLDLRLGTADRPARVQVTGPRPVGWIEPVLRRAPAGVDLEAAGVLGLAGPADWMTERLDWVLVQCATLHSPDELQIVVLAPDTAEDELGWVRWLPHARDPSGAVLAGWDAEGVDALLRGLGAELERRADAVRQRRATPHRALLVVLVGAGSLARRPAVADLLVRGPALGIRLVCTESDDRLLPDACRAVLVGDQQRSELRVDRGDRQVITPDALRPGAADDVARCLAPLRRAGDTPAGGLPDAVRFTDLGPPHTADGVRAAWRLEPERTAVVVGRDGDGPAALDIARDGPHAIVAGTSGSGKSELLQTWVAALAAANTPDRLSIVFVDYKGGSAFKDLVALPHVVGSVTNLDERLATRALASLDAELRRRQEQLAAAGAGDRADHLRRAVGVPFPRLLIVVDELAEMKERLPDLVDGLVGVARIGRSLGVHLVLATQKPAGVVDGQIRANADLRICLRTANPGESMDVIETGVAADIPKDRPGRAVVVRGGAGAALVQTARITTPASSGAAVVRRAVPLRWDDVAVPPPPAVAGSGLRTDLDVLVDAVVEAARTDGLVAPFRPWTDPLPPVVALDALPALPLMLPLGLRDRPARQLQEPLAVPLGSGHLVVVGSGRTGRTAALRGIAAGLARAAGPDAVHVHAVDAAGGLAGLVALPHTGVVVDPEDGERLERLLTRLVGEVRDRRRRMAEHGASVVGELTAPPPQIVLLVDGWTGLTDAADSAAAAAFHDLLGSGSAAAGVTVCLAGDERLLKGRVLGRIDHRLCLRLNTPSDATLLGLDIRNLPAGLPPGRALWAADGSEVQLPLLAADPSGPAQAAALAALGRTLRDRYPADDPTADDPTAAPLRLDPLPVRIGLDAVLALAPPPGRSLLLGVSGDRLAPVWAGLDGPGHVVVAGPARSGRSTALASIAAAAASSGLRVVLAAARPGPAHRAAADRGVAVCGPADLPAEADLVLVDDADLAVWDDAAVDRLVTGPRLVVGALLDAFGFGASGLVKAARRSIGPVVLLSPPNHLAADGVGVKIDRTAAFSGPPGRAFLSVDGTVHLGQVPDPHLSR